MLFQPNPKSFLTGEGAFLTTNCIDADPFRIAEEITFDLRHEGFIGIPHGGLAMGLCLDAWHRIGLPEYPIKAAFKFGGSGVFIGDTAIFSVSAEENRVHASITKNGDKTPYLKADIMPFQHDQEWVDFPEPSPDGRKLPYYRNCFVCGHHRDEIGLQRRFQVEDTDFGPVVSTTWGLVDDDLDRAGGFLISSRELHPTVLISIFDENTAWGGFMATKSAGLSVRLEFVLLRPVLKTEKLIFLGKPSGIRGNPKSPRFFLAEGTIFSMKDEASPEPVAFGRGEWIIMNQYTRQIKQNLLPPDDWTWIFG